MDESLLEFPGIFFHHKKCIMKYIFFFKYFHVFPTKAAGNSYIIKLIFKYMIVHKCTECIEFIVLSIIYDEIQYVGGGWARRCVSL